jgi:glycerol uptake facilitator-like aquaporin
MSEATTDRALAGNEEEEEVLPPEPTTKSIILGEVVGSFLLSVLGLGIGVSATLWGAPGAPWFADIWPTAAGWALAIALGIYVTATLSGAHFNPAVTITMAVTGRHPWRLVPLYILCQVIGWFLGAAVLMAMFGRNLFDFAASKNIDIGSPASTGWPPRSRPIPRTRGSRARPQGGSPRCRSSRAWPARSSARRSCSW